MLSKKQEVLIREAIRNLTDGPSVDAHVLRALKHLLEVLQLNIDDPKAPVTFGGRIVS